jgi:hypothetical protein
MTNMASPLLAGAVAMASLVAMLIFLRHWRQTRDSFFLLFATSFGLDSATRILLGLWRVDEQSEPLVYLTRLVTFGLIIAAIVQKNLPRRRQ